MTTRAAIVTGAAHGLGQAIAGRLLADEWSVVEADIDPCVTAIAAEPAPDRTLRLVLDISAPESVAALVEKTVERFGRIDAVINNAGVGGPSDPVTRLDPEDFRRVLDVNLVGPFLLSRAAAPVMIDGACGGRIVNLGSLFGQQGVAGGAAYCASKGGLASLTHSLALELAPFAITVNTVAPGNMWTRMHEEEVARRAAESGRSVDAEREALRASIPLGRHGTGMDIAGAVSWLLSDDAAYVTGQTVSVNGGVFLT